MTPLTQHITMLPNLIFNPNFLLTPRVGAWVLCCFALALPRLAAQTFETKIESAEQMLGASFEVSFALSSDDAKRFTPPSFKDFKVLSGPHEGRSISIINGRSSAQTVWTYELEARRAGTCAIGPASVVSGSKTLTTKPLTLKIVPPSASKGLSSIPPGADEQLFLISELDHTTAYPGQQLRWQIKVYTQLSLDGADIVELPNFEGFYTKEKRRFDTRVQYQTLRGKKYAVKVLHEEAIFPQETGDLTIGAAKARLALEQDGTTGSFFGRRTVLMETPPIRVTVKALPEPVPERFSGAVGRYAWETAADSLSVTTDGSITLLLTIKGNGNSRRIMAPKLILAAGLEVFEPRVKSEEEYESVEQIIHEKTWEYVVLPKAPGTYALVTDFVFFDPDSNRYRTLRLDSIDSIRVTPGPNYQPPSAASDTTVALPLSADLKPTWAEKVQKWTKSPVFWLLLGLPILGLALFFFLKKQRSVQPAFSGPQGHVLTAPRPAAPPAKPPIAPRPPVTTATAQPLARPIARLSEAQRWLSEGNSRAFYGAIFKALQSHLSQQLHIPLAQLAQDTLPRLLAERGVSTLQIQRILSVWHTCEQALFAAQPQTSQMEATLQTTQRVLEELG